MADSDQYLAAPKGFATTAIHVAQEPEQWDSMAVVAPLVCSTTFKQNGPADFKVKTFNISTYNLFKYFSFRNTNTVVPETPAVKF